MPVYDYDCDACGPFTALRPMAECRDPRACPACGAAAPRAILSAPSVAGMDPARRRALAAKERSASRPRLSSASHAADCSCCLRRWPSSRAAASPGSAGGFTADAPRRDGR